jgi:hypothetical protein
MARLPGYDSQVTPATGSVQPGNIYLPNIHPVETDTGATKMLTKLSAQAEEVGTVWGKVAQQQDHAERVKQQANAITAITLEEPKISAKYANDFAPDAPDRAWADMQELAKNTLANVDPKHRDVIEAHVQMNLAQAWKGIYNNHAKGVLTLEGKDVERNLDVANDKLADLITSNADIRDIALAQGNRDGMLEQYNTIKKFPSGVKDAKIWSDNRFKSMLLDKMAVKNPELLKKEIQTPEGREKYGITSTEPGGMEKKLEWINSVVHKNQSQEYDKVLGVINQGQNPTPEQMRKLNNGQVMQINNIMKAREQIDNQEVVKQVGVKVIDYMGNPNSTPEDGQKLLAEISSNPNLSASTILKFYGDVSKVKSASTLSANQQIEGTAKFLGGAYSPHYQNFAYYMYNNPDGMASMPKGLNQKEIALWVREKAQPFWDDYNKATIRAAHDKEVGKQKPVMVNIEGAGAGLGGAPPAPVGQSVKPTERAITPQEAAQDPVKARLYLLQKYGKGK